MAKVFVVGMAGQSNLWGQGSTTAQITGQEFSITPSNAWIWDKLGRTSVHTDSDDGAWATLVDGFGFNNPANWASLTAYSVGDQVRGVDAAVVQNVYTCINAHTSSASDEPGVGVNWEVEWRRGVIEIGPELQLHHKLAQIIQTSDHPIYYIKYARGGLGLAPDTISWSNRETGKSFDLYRDRYWLPAINDIYSNGDRPYFLGMCWQHGAKDAQLEAAADAYKANLLEFMREMRSQTIMVDNAPWVLGSLTTITPDPGFQDTVRAAYAPVAYEDNRATWFDTIQRTDDNGRALFAQHDNEHFNGEGQVDMGNFFAEGLLSRMRRNTPALIPNR